ncbi:MAG: SH3 domain-containing protein, partial [Dehalococcoidia bacterium]
VVTARAVDVASLRTAPSTDALITGAVPAGSTATVVGCAGGCSWLLLATPSGTAWSARHFWVVNGDLSTIGGR